MYDSSASFSSGGLGSADRQRRKKEEELVFWVCCLRIRSNGFDCFAAA